MGWAVWSVDCRLSLDMKISVILDQSQQFCLLLILVIMIGGNHFIKKTMEVCFILADIKV